MDSGLAARIDTAFLLQIVKYMNVVSFVVLVTDYFHTIHLEVSFIWPRKWGLIEILFLLARYSPFFDVPLHLYYSLTPSLSQERCLIFWTVTSCSTICSIGVAEAILALRTHALSGCNRKLLTFLIVQYTGIYIAVVIVLTTFLRTVRFGEPPLPTMVGCYVAAASPTFVVAFLLLLFHKLTVMILTIWIGVKKYRHSRNPLVMSLYRDGTIYFIYLFVVSVTNIAVLSTSSANFVDLLTTFQRVMHSILSTRIILHVRSIAAQEEARESLPNVRLELSALNLDQDGGSAQMISSFEAARVSKTWLPLPQP